MYYDGERRKKLIYRTGPKSELRYNNFDALSRLNAQFLLPGQTPPTQSFADQQAVDTFAASIDTTSAAAKEEYDLTLSDTRATWRENAVQFQPTYNGLSQITQLLANSNIIHNYVYDNNGNRTEDSRFQYRYDCLDQLVRVVDKQTGQTWVEYSYDALGRRVTKDHLGMQTSYIFDGLRCVQESNSSEVVQHTYGEKFYQPLIKSSGGKNLFLHHDSSASIKAVTDDNGSVKYYFDFTAFGKADFTDADGNSLTLLGSEIVPVFAGLYYDGEVGLYRSSSRLYDPQTGCFIQRDGIQYVDSANPYLYAKHNPVDFIDPTGDPVPILVAIGVASAEGSLTILGTSVVGALVGSAAGAGTNAMRQGAQLLSGEGFNPDGSVKDEFSLSEMGWSSLMGGAFGALFPLLAAASGTAGLIVGGGLLVHGSYHGAQSFMKGEVVTGSFDVITALFPFGAKKVMPTKYPKLFKKSEPSTPSETYTVQGNKKDILASKNIYGNTEGSVYAHPDPKASFLKTGINSKEDPVVLKFSGDNAKVFQSHEINGPWSLGKYFFGQQKAGFGDLTFTKAVATKLFVPVRVKGEGKQPTEIFELSGVKLNPGKFANKKLKISPLKKLWGRRMLLDVPTNALIALGTNPLPGMVDALADPNLSGGVSSPEKS